MSNIENQLFEVNLEEAEIVTQLVSSSTQEEITDSENADENVNGCDSTTEVNETVLEEDNDQETRVESSSQYSEDTIDSLEGAGSPPIDELTKTEEHLPKTSESCSESENATPKTSRELKSILALSKEAKLDTNLSSHRRKTLHKLKDNAAKKPQKITNFPVTAESELENFDEQNNEKAIEKKNLEKGKSLIENVIEDASSEETKRSVQWEGYSGEVAMLKKPNKDTFCWRCHHDEVQVACETCPRSYHLKCLKQTIADLDHWPCPECVSILKAENTQTRSRAMRGMTLEHLCSLLKFAVKRMKQCNGSEPFVHAVDEKQFPEYRNYVVQPMTLSTLERNIKDNLYGSTQAFETDAKWILHNSIIFNSSFSDQSKLTTAAKTIIKICKQEMAEIENCPSCYLNANTKKHSWFVEVCPKPHLLVWAKLKGFPYWPAKVMSISASGMADVRFFGAHDRAWVSTKDCFLYSVKDPNSGKQKRNDIMECVKELELYVENLKKIYGKVNYAPFKTHLEVDNYLKQLQLFLPSYKGESKEIRKSKDINKNGKSGSEITKNVNNEIQHNERRCDDENEESETEENVNANNNLNSKGGSMTRIDYREDPIVSDKLKITKPIKTIILRKRSSTGNNVETNIKLRRRNSSKDDGQIKADIVENKNEENASPSKLRITDQLIKKLEDMDEQKGGIITKEYTGKYVHDEEKDKVNSSSGERNMSGQLSNIIKSKTVTPEGEGTNIINKPITLESKGNELDDNDTKEIGKDNYVVAEKFDNSDESSLDKGSCKAKEVEIDEDNICSIIHSSLVTPKENKEKCQKVETNKKRKSNIETEDKNIFPPNKMVKLVPIENILQKKVNIETATRSEQPDKEIEQNNSSANVSKTDCSKKVNNETALEVKQEIESDEDLDVQYMEAKRKYLSALNISEKQKVPLKPKGNEIRTRSKTEEKKSKLNDNLTESIENTMTNSCNISVLNKSSDGVKEIYVKPLSKLKTPKHKARKSFPTPNYSKKTIIARKIVPKPTREEEIRIVNPTLQPLTTTTASVMILPKLHFNKPSPTTRANDSPSVLAVLPESSISPDQSRSKKVLDGSQNYIPQNESDDQAISNNGVLLNNLLSGGTVSNPSVVDIDNLPNPLETDLSTLNEILPETLSKGVSDLLCQPPPKLKPKPMGLLNTPIDAGVPSTAGPVASRINAMAQKLSDYFRGLLVETINDLGKDSNPETTISNLKLDIEELNHRHSIELSEIRKNVSVVLKDIQKSIVEERERVVNELKASYELKIAKKVEEAKSKQWCANCSKEAQFYCCWNTSYCDYPCQQKHWPKHMSKCTQNTNQNQTSTSVRPQNQQLVLTPTVTPKFGALFAKPQKIYLKRANTPFKQSPGGHITLVESTPGNFELLGSGPIAVNGKILASTSVIEKFKNANIVTVTAPSSSNNTQLTNVNQKVTITSKSSASKSTANLSDSER